LKVARRQIATEDFTSSVEEIEVPIVSQGGTKSLLDDESFMQIFSFMQDDVGKKTKVSKEVSVVTEVVQDENDYFEASDVSGIDLKAFDKRENE
jgi:hypothetical protein